MDQSFKRNSAFDIGFCCHGKGVIRVRFQFKRGNVKFKIIPVRIGEAKRFFPFCHIDGVRFQRDVLPIVSCNNAVKCKAVGSELKVPVVDEILSVCGKRRCRSEKYKKFPIHEILPYIAF